jgi:phosphatidylcholine synthase
MTVAARTRLLGGLAVHAFTASGAAVALMALMAAVDRDFPAVFAWLALALFIDGVDGTLARAVNIEARVPWIDGAVLDLVIDFLTYVFVPIVAIWRSDLLPPVLDVPICALIVTASAIYFGDRRMKTEDNWFRGFPSLWNVLALYLFVVAPPQWINAAVLLLATVLLFAPVVFVHPMRVRRLRPVTLAVTIAWFAFAALAWDAALQPGWGVKAGLLVCGLYFIGLPLLRGSPWADGKVDAP